MAAASEDGAVPAQAAARVEALEEQISRLAQMARTLGAVEARDSAREVATASEALSKDLASKTSTEGSAEATEDTKKLEARLGQVAAQAAKVRSAAMERIARDMEPLRVEVAQSVLTALARKGRGAEDHFALADRAGDGSVTCEDFLAFVGRGSESFPQERLRSLFDYLDYDDDGRLGREDIERCLAVLYKSTRPNVDLCHTMGLTQGKQLRRLQMNETLELLEGPVRESNKAERIRCRSLQDGAVGWAMARGANGVAFVQQSRIQFQVKCDTPLTSTLAVKDCKTVRMLKGGELVEVLLWERPDKESGLKRLKARALRDSAIGWATTVGNAGAVHLQAV